VRDAGFSRFWPNRLRHRVAWAILIVVALSHLAGYGLSRTSSVSTEDLAMARRVGVAMASAVDAAKAATATGKPAGPATIPFAGKDLDIVWKDEEEGEAGKASAGQRRQETTVGGLKVLVESPRALRLPDESRAESAELGFVHLSESIVFGGTGATVRVPVGEHGWLVFASPLVWHTRWTPFERTLALMGVIGAIVWLAVILGTTLAEPIERLRERVERPVDGRDVRPIPLEGPEELRAIAQSVNRVRTALGEQVEGRTRMLAAISHDLRTPATRLRLRAEYVEDESLRAKILGDVDELSKMISSSLEFFREDAVREEKETFSFASLLQSLCDDYADMGLPVTLHEPPPLRFGTVRTVFSGKAVAAGWSAGQPSARLRQSDRQRHQIWRSRGCLGGRHVKRDCGGDPGFGAGNSGRGSSQHLQALFPAGRIAQQGNRRGRTRFVDRQVDHRRPPGDHRSLEHGARRIERPGHFAENAVEGGACRGDAGAAHAI
jgi:hypothetical protein